ncbi:MAG: hypothetical protein IJ744_10730 [Lachnospiraceae bacterium]|nr:hypothetical protein [Lachnospiraceae bacterium]
MKRTEFVIKENYSWELRGPLPSDTEGEEVAWQEQEECFESKRSDEVDLEPKEYFLLGVKSALEMLKNALEHTEVVLAKSGEECEERSDGGTKSTHRVCG